MGLSNSSFRTTVARSRAVAAPPHLALTRDEMESVRSTLAVLLSPLDALDADNWRGQVGAAVRELLHADRTAFRLDAPGITPLYSEDYSQKTLDAYSGYYSAIDSTRQRREQLGIEVWNRALLHGSDDIAFRKSEIYRDFFLPNRILDAIGITIALDDSGREASLFCHREKANTPEFGERGLALLELVLPAFRAGVREFIRYSNQHASLSAHLDSLLEGIRVCDLNGKTIHQNGAFTSAFKGESSNHKIQKGIEETLQQLVSFGKERPMNLSALAGRRITIEVHTHTASYEVGGSFLGRELHGPEPRIAITLHSLPPNTALSDQALKERYRLTTRELEITRRLAQGQSTKEVAHACGISLHTARRHTESIFTKLGVRNRSQIGPKLRAG